VEIEQLGDTGLVVPLLIESGADVGDTAAFTTSAAVVVRLWIASRKH
jgi:hypothetical protein